MKQASVAIPIKILLAAILIVTSGCQTSREEDLRVPDVSRSIPRRSSSEVLQRPVKLSSGIGVLHQKVTTSSAEAQAYYNQGIAYLHSYGWIEAARAFHEALRRDENLAMAHLGLARAYFNADAFEDAVKHLNRASELAAQGKCTPKEAKWIAIIKLQMQAIFAPAGDQQTHLHNDYKHAIDELIALDPADAHAWVLRGNAEESRPSGRGQGGGTEALGFYEKALQLDSTHWGADHYLVHSYENLGKYEQAAEHAHKYATAAPGIAHAQHMYAHVLPRLGRWRDALEQLILADRLEREYFTQGVAPIEDWHRGHNLHLMGIAQLRLGNAEEARRLLKEAFDLEVRGVRDGRYIDAWLEFLLLHEQYEEALVAARSAQSRSSAVARLLGAVREAEALLALDRFTEARTAHASVQKYFAEYEKEVSGHPVFQILIQSYSRELLEPLEAQFALRGDNPQLGEESLIALADDYCREADFDSWATGLFRVEYFALVAKKAGRTELMRALIDRLQCIDPDYTSRFR